MFKINLSPCQSVVFVTWNGKNGNAEPTASSECCENGLHRLNVEIHTGAANEQDTGETREDIQEGNNKEIKQKSRDTRRKQQFTTYS